VAYFKIRRLELNKSSQDTRLLVYCVSRNEYIQDTIEKQCYEIRICLYSILCR
jgi:hypothetical protein